MPEAIATGRLITIGTRRVMPDGSCNSRSSIRGKSERRSRHSGAAHRDRPPKWLLGAESSRSQPDMARTAPSRVRLRVVTKPRLVSPNCHAADDLPKDEPTRAAFTGVGMSAHGALRARLSRLMRPGRVGCLVLIASSPRIFYSPPLWTSCRRPAAPVARRQGSAARHP